MDQPVSRWQVTSSPAQPAAPGASLRRESLTEQLARGRREHQAQLAELDSIIAKEKAAVRAEIEAAEAARLQAEQALRATADRVAEEIRQADMEAEAAVREAEMARAQAEQGLEESERRGAVQQNRLLEEAAKRRREAVRFSYAVIVSSRSG